MSEATKTGYRVRAIDPFMDLIRSMADYELRPGQTVSFLGEVDLTEVEEVRRTSRCSADRKPSYTSFVTKALAIALREFPYANRRLMERWLPFRATRLQQFLSSDVSVAVERSEPDAESVAFVDVIRGADLLTLSQITVRLRELAHADEENNAQWRIFKRIARRLPRGLAALVVRLPLFSARAWHRYRGGAALISSPAKYGVDAVLSTWTSPLGVSFGVVKERAVVKAGRVVACPTFHFLVNFDRRVMAGAQAARFFARLVELLEHASSELADAEVDKASERAAPAADLVCAKLSPARPTGR